MIGKYFYVSEVEVVSDISLQKKQKADVATTNDQQMFNMLVSTPQTVNLLYIIDSSVFPLS